MVFSSLLFLYLFLPANLLLYYVRKNARWRNLTLVAFSLFFYAWGEPLWVFVLMMGVSVNFLCGRLVEVSRRKGLRSMARLGVVISVGMNLGLLIVFKYTGWLIDTLNLFLPQAVRLEAPPILLPIGISFYTFQAVSYVVDVYRGQAKAQESYYKLLLYISLYPQLVAGPIVRYSDIAGQIDRRCTTAQDLSAGLTRLLCGLTKKVLVANTAGKLLTGFTAGESVAGAWFGMLLFTLQIYYDFSGYSDMAIGLGRMFGFTYLENFDYPYISRSVTEFWRRWHISLSTFFRDYVYIPLGGGRRHAWRNLFIVWFLTGLWHGASWNFVVWGLYYGVLIALERLFGDRMRAPRVLSHLYLVFVTLVGWTLFYFTDPAMLLHQLGVMFGLSGAPLWDARVGLVVMNNAFWLLGSLLFCMPVVPCLKRCLARLPEGGIALVRFGETALNLGMLALCTCLLAGQSYNPFLYFRF